MRLKTFDRTLSPNRPILVVKRFEKKSKPDEYLAAMAIPELLSKFVLSGIYLRFARFHNILKID